MSDHVTAHPLDERTRPSGRAATRHRSPCPRATDNGPSSPSSSSSPRQIPPHRSKVIPFDRARVAPMEDTTSRLRPERLVGRAPQHVATDNVGRSRIRTDSDAGGFLASPSSRTPIANGPTPSMVPTTITAADVSAPRSHLSSTRNSSYGDRGSRSNQYGYAMRDLDRNRVCGRTIVWEVERCAGTAVPRRSVGRGGTVDPRRKHAASNDGPDVCLL